MLPRLPARVAPAAPVTVVTALLLASPAAHADDTAPPPDPPTASPAGDPHRATARFRPGSGLRVESADGRYRLDVRARVQLLYTAEHDGQAAEGERIGHGLQVRRARVTLAGHLFDGRTKYKLELAFSPRDLGLQDGRITRAPVNDAWVASEHLRDLSARVGQYKIPFSREHAVSSGSLQLVDRSLVHGEFAFDRDLGVTLYSDDLAGLERLRWYATVATGEGHSAADLGDAHLLWAGRVEVFPLGAWDDYDDQAHLSRDRRARLGLGAAYAFHDDARRTRNHTGSPFADGGTADTHNVTADLAFEVAGFSLEGAFHWRRGRRTFGSPPALPDPTPIPVEAPRDGLGWLVQAGVLLPRAPVELAARYAQVLGAEGSSLDDAAELGGGVSAYLSGHAYKLQADVHRLWGPEGIGQGSDRFRLQLQVAL